jgi:uncharacterized protein YggT (Ycf19 family)
MKHIVTGQFAKQLVVFIFILLEAFLVTRVLLKLFTANPAAQFVSWVYDLTYPFVNPFIGMFPNQINGIDYEIEFSTIFAMIIYALVGYAIIYFVSLLEKPKKKW